MSQVLPTTRFQLFLWARKRIQKTLILKDDARGSLHKTYKLQATIMHLQQCRQQSYNNQN
uniref:Uncharacterized protein n=1 Tax=Romanomermis culicivorax TaxID=13658 RepID=A0A915KJ63_ROMCU